MTATPKFGPLSLEEMEVAYDQFQERYDSKDPRQFEAETNLPICGCGTPHEAFAAFLAVFDVEPDGAGTDREIQLPGRIRERAEAFVAAHPHAAVELIYHIADQMRWLEHGGSLPGWLTEKGRTVLRACQTIRDMYLERAATTRAVDP